MSAPTPYTSVARVVKVHGLKGEVVAVPADGLIFVLEEEMSIRFVPPVPGMGATRICTVRPTPKGSILKLEGIDTVAVAQSLVGTSILIKTADLPELHLEESPYEELFGAAVYDEQRGFLGEIAEVIETGANDVWVVSGGPFGEVLIPVIEQVVLGWTDDERNRIDVVLLDGLLPDEMEEA